MTIRFAMACLTETSSNGRMSVDRSASAPTITAHNAATTQTDHADKCVEYVHGELTTDRPGSFVFKIVNALLTNLLDDSLTFTTKGSGFLGSWTLLGFADS